MTNDQFARRVKLAVNIGGHDATSYVQPSLLDFSYTDNSSGKADEIQLSLHDREGQWNGPWQPQKGTIVTASLTVLDWFGQGKHATLPCGKFTVDEVTFSGPPDKVQIKAVSASLSSGLKDQSRTKAWENFSLQNLCAEVAQANGLELQYSGDPMPFTRQDQREESDLTFINRLASERGLNCKVHDGKLIVFDAKSADAQSPWYTIAKKGQQFSPSSYSFKTKSAGTAFAKCDLNYIDPDTGEKWNAEAKVPPKTPAPAEKSIEINKRVESPADAERLSKGALRKANEREVEASLECMGNPAFVAGITIALQGFGRFDGKYFVKKATHKVGTGYTTSLELRQTLEY